MFQVHPDDVAAAIERISVAEGHGVESIVCVLSTTSCFAPRVPDDTLAIGRICKARGVPYVVNNAYGLQSQPIAKRLNAALENGAVDAFVQSGDKNFLTPVGGAVIAGRKDFVGQVSALYPGRASAAPIVDLFITLLEMGRSGWRRLQADRRTIFSVFLEQLRVFAERRGEILLTHERNDISVALTLQNWKRKPTAAKTESASQVDPAATEQATTRAPPTGASAATALGALLFRHRVTGPKVVVPGAVSTKDVCGRRFVGYGTHSDADGPPLLIIACGVGMTMDELTLLMQRLDQAYPAPSFNKE
jgi:O-phospho-L-seryl-tRNASec:L-selenocysteinyl-tRNA synthase